MKDTQPDAQEICQYMNSKAWIYTVELEVEHSQPRQNGEHSQAKADQMGVPMPGGETNPWRHVAMCIQEVEKIWSFF